METETSAPPAEYATTASGARQPVCLPDAPKYDPAWFSERERYLLERGWEKEPTQSGLPTYRDPTTSRLKGEYKVVGELPVKGDDLKKSAPVQQFHVPPAAFSFTLEEAVEVQRRRDALGTAGPTPLDRLGACEQKCNELERQVEQFRARVRTLLTSPQITFEGLKLGLRELIGA